MAQGVLYTDLRFAKGPGGRGTANQALEAALGMDEAESPHENITPELMPVGTAGEGAQHSPGCCSRRRCVPAGLLAVNLLLLVAAMVLGACYWKVTRQLQDTSLEQVAERGRFSQEVRMRDQSLEQMRQELAQVQEELQQAWKLGNNSQLELGRWEAELAHVSGALAATQKELNSVQGRLNASESTVTLLRSCTAIDKKTWDDSRAECEEKYSQLLITKSWSRWTVPSFLKNADVAYWIGLQKSRYPWYEYDWLEEGEPDGEGLTDAWFWVDGSLYERPWQPKSNGSCAVISRGNIKPAPCEGPDDLHLWICEKAAGPSSPFIG
ncbi:C-type lectin domain family 17, member A isoform X2 [Meleagris gallopavo]|uniref:C-type lectin domain family 17, member A isoform X2 n=1 Tax=Meleagris gallopavo TaxID=9103 RepID=UPI000549DED5|nr:C-type lectin domain family 17, member A isoform X2 [Meleagris gallopavo]